MRDTRMYFQYATEDQFRGAVECVLEGRECLTEPSSLPLRRNLGRKLRSPTPFTCCVLSA